MNKITEELKKVGTFFIATVEGDQPRVRPFGALDEFEGKLYLITSNKKPVFAQLTANPKVEICSFNGSEWVRIACELVPDDRVEAKKHMLDAYPHLRALYDENDDNTIVLYMKNATAQFSAFDPNYEARTVTF